MYNRLAKFSIEEVRAMWECQHDLGKRLGKVFKNGAVREKKVYFQMCGTRFHLISDRYDTFFLKGLSCNYCGIEGKYFWLESNTKDKKTKEWTNYHFNLYGIDSNGEEVMLTKDHIVPKSKGGKNCIDNYQCLCVKCNGEKADKDVS